MISDVGVAHPVKGAAAVALFVLFEAAGRDAAVCLPSCPYCVHL